MCACKQNALLLTSDRCAPAGNVGGTSWQGQKTVFQDEVHDSEAAATQAADAEPPLPASNADHITLEKVKWKKIARQLLEQVM